MRISEVWQSYCNFECTALTFKNINVHFRGNIHRYGKILGHSLDIVLNNEQKGINMGPPPPELWEK